MPERAQDYLNQIKNRPYPHKDGLTNRGSTLFTTQGAPSLFVP